MKENSQQKKFIVFSDGELTDLAHWLQFEGHEVVAIILDEGSKNVGKGIFEIDQSWWRYLGQDYIWVFSGCERGDLQDWLREQGEAVFGGSKEGDRLENERQLNQEWFLEAGFKQPHSENFTDIDEAIDFVAKNSDKKWILKQNGDMPKSLSHKGKFDNNEDMLFHLEELKKRWNEHEYGNFDCDLMEVVDGLEVAASVFFNGEEYMKNKEGKVVGWLNFEEKKEADGDLGETTGETGTTFLGVTEDNKLFKSILIRPKLIKRLKEIGFRGVFDINTIVEKNGNIVTLEPTMRPGYPASSYEFIEGLNMNTGEMIANVAMGENSPIEIHNGVGMVICIVARPFPIENTLALESSTSIGEKIWILDKGQPIDDLTDEQMKHIHFSNVEYIEDIGYRVATKDGYILMVTGRGKDVKTTRESLIEYIKNNVYVSGMKFRQDIGKRLEKLNI